MMNHNPLKASAAKPLSRGVAAHSVVAAGDGSPGRRDQTSAGGIPTVPPSCLLGMSTMAWCVVCCHANHYNRHFPGMSFFSEWQAVKSSFEWVLQRKLIYEKRCDGFSPKQKTSLLRFWHQKIDWGKSDSHIHLIPSPPAETTCWIYGGCYILQSSCDWLMKSLVHHPSSNITKLKKKNSAPADLLTAAHISCESWQKM